MTTERVTIQVESNIGEDGPLTVMDTLDQFKDAFELLTAAISAEAGGETIRWRLEKLSKNSPATVTAVAYSPDPEVIVAPILRRGKQRFTRDVTALKDGEVAPWIREKAPTAKAFLRRNLNGVGKTTFGFDTDAPITVLVEKTARASLKAIERHEANQQSVDRARSEYGTVDAHVTEVKTWNGKPAIYLKDRLSGKVIPCVLSDDLAEREGGLHSLEDVWREQRIRVRGLLFYDKSGSLARINAVEMKNVTPREVDFKRLRDLNILDGASPSEHLEKLWGYADE